MSYHGDIRLGDTIDVKFSTVSTAGAPTTLAGSPAVAAYVGNSTTEITSGITLTVDFDTRTGLHNVRVVASSGNGFATATNVDLVLTAGTVGGTSVVGYVIGSFSIENRSALMPTTTARTLGVDASGRALADLDTIKTQSITCAAGVTVLASVGTAATSTAQTGDAFARLGAPAGASVSADVAAVKAQTAAIETDTGTDIPATLATIAGYLDTEIAAIKAKTDSLTFTVAGQLDANVQYVNDVQVQGTGASGNEWRPV